MSPDTLWNFCPSFPAADLYAILFGLITIAHVAQAINHRRMYCGVKSFCSILFPFQIVVAVIKRCTESNFSKRLVS